MENNEDILKDFEELTSVKVENAHFDMSINEDQFGQKTLNIIHSKKNIQVAMGAFEKMSDVLWVVLNFVMSIILLIAIIVKIKFSLELPPLNSGSYDFYSAVFCFFLFYIPSFISVKNFLFLDKTINDVEHLNIGNDRITFYTKTISEKGKIELLKSEITHLEVSSSGTRFNNRHSYHLIVFTNTNKSYKLITHNFNKKALEHICQKINERLNLTS